MLTELTLLGKSDASISIILDNLESNNLFPEIIIVNNLNLPIENSFEHPKFKWRMVEAIENPSSIFALGVANAYTKRKVVDNFDISELTFINIKHQSSLISSTAKLGKGLLINNLAAIGPHASIGDFVNIGNRASVNHHCVVEDLVSINPGAMVCGGCYIGRGTLIGAGSVIRDGIKIGRNSIIGAGSVVVKDIPDNVVAYGNPCKPMRENG